MAERVVSLVPVRIAELAVGKPVQQPIYDWYGKLLLAAGCVIQDQGQLDELIGKGFIYDAAWDIEHDMPKAPPAKVLPKGKIAEPPPSSDTSREASAGKETIANMDDVRWHVGEVLYLQPVDHPNVRYMVRLIGFVKNKTVVVTAPTVEGRYEFVRDGQTFVVRAFSGRNAYAFMASAVKSVHSPYPYLHLSYPKELRCTVVRRGVRARVNLIASISLGEQERTAAAVLNDLSIGGASGTIKHAFGTKGEQGHVKFKVHVAGQDEVLNLKAVLRSVAPVENGEGFKHGFEFIDPPTRDRLILSAYVHQILVEGT